MGRLTQFLLGALIGIGSYSLVRVPQHEHDFFHDLAASSYDKDTVLIPLPSMGFDPTEVAVPWKILKELGHTVVFATPSGKPSSCDPIVLDGPVLLQPSTEVKDLYKKMTASAEFAKPVSYSSLKVQDYDGLILPGGHHPNMSSLLDDPVIQGKVAEFWALKRPVGAICHGTLLLARTKDANGKPLFHDRSTTSVPSWLESQAYALTKYVYGLENYQLSTTNNSYVEPEIRHALDTHEQYFSGPVDLLAPFLPGSRTSHTHAFVHRDQNYLSARFWGDAYLFALTFARMLNEHHSP